jgi:plastocyanin
MRFGHQRAFWLAVVLIFAAGSATAGIVEGRVQTQDAKLDLAGFVVWLDDINGPFPPPDATAVMDQRSLRFVPHVLAIEAGTTVEFANSDPLAHNVFSISGSKRFNLGLYGRGTSRQIKFDRGGVVQVLCNVHREMSAYVVVVKNPYFARTAADGSFRIAGVPGGAHRLRIWHEGMEDRTRDIKVLETGVARVSISVD